MMTKKKFFLIAFILCFTLRAFSSISVQDGGINEFASKFKTNLELKKIPEYLQFFSPELRDREEQNITSMFNDFNMDTVAVYIASAKEQNENEAIIYLQVFFQNSYSVILDVWKLSLTKSENRWQIAEKKPSSQAKTLYRMKIPSKKAVRVDSFEVEHEDIIISFKNAVCFFDNIPEFETALIVVGKGKLNFTPSHPREKHQLELIYKKKHLEDKLNYLYLRVSDSFFNEKIKIIPSQGDALPVTKSEQNKAYSIFTKHYSRSYTVRNSFTGELLSLLPQGEEAVFEFDGAKIGNVSYIYSPFSEEEVNFYQWQSNRILNLYSPPKAEGKKRMFISFGQKLDVKNCDVEIDFKPQ